VLTTQSGRCRGGANRADAVVVQRLEPVVAIGGVDVDHTPLSSTTRVGL
jgi:hypothetical protein